MRDAHRVAIVTGASRGLGEVIAGVLAERNYDLVIGARDAALGGLDLLVKTSPSLQPLASFSEDIDGPCRQQGEDRQRDDGLEHHQHLAPSGQHGRVGR